MTDIDTEIEVDEGAFVAGYMECALWASSWYGPGEEPADEPRPMDDYFSPEDIDTETRRDIEEECEAFVRDNLADLLTYVEYVGGWDHAGHDFWLTRNRHGTGYWDRGYREPAEVNEALTRLTDASHAYGEAYPEFEWGFQRYAEETARMAWEDSD